LAARTHAARAPDASPGDRGRDRTHRCAHRPVRSGAIPARLRAPAPRVESAGLRMRPGALVAAAVTVTALGFRWNRLTAQLRALGVAAALVLLAWGSGVIHLPNLETI